MKTVTKSISLSDKLAAFAEQEAEEGGYGNFSAYIAELLRARRQAQIDADLKLLGEAAKGPGGPEPTQEIVKACKTVRREMRREKWSGE